MRVDRSIIVVGAFLSILGAALVYNGYGFVQLERGWTEVIAGTTVFSTGLVLIALGFILRTLSAIAASADRAALLLAKGRVFTESAQAAVAHAGIAVAPAAEPAPEPETPPEPEFHPAASEVIKTAEVALTEETPVHPAPVSEAVPTEEPISAPIVASRPEVPTQIEARSTAANPLSWMIRPNRPNAEPTPIEPRPRPAAEPAFAEPDYRERRLQRVNFRETAPPASVVEEPVSQETAAQEPLFDAPVFKDLAPQEHDLHETSPPPHQPVHETASTAVDWLDEVMAEADPFFQPGPAPAAAKPEAEETAIVAPAHDVPAEPARVEEAYYDAPNEHGASVTPDDEASPETVRRPPLEVIGQYEANGTHYIMYADGSIDAEAAHGSYHFASMEELKQFIESQK